MTDDIVARLREDIRDHISARIKITDDNVVLRNEIERLRAALTQIEKSAVHGMGHYKGAVAQKIVREVLLIVRNTLSKEGKQ